MARPRRRGGGVEPPPDAVDWVDLREYHEECRKCGLVPKEWIPRFVRANIGNDVERRRQWERDNPGGTPPIIEFITVECSECGFGWKMMTKDA